MAITVTNVGTAGAASGALSVVPGSNIPAGSVIFVAVNDTVQTTLGVPVDSAGNTYQLAVTRNSSSLGFQVALFYAYNTAQVNSGGFVRYTLNGGGFGGEISVFYATGLDTADPFDGTTDFAASATTGSPSVQMAAAPTRANSLAIGVCGANANLTITSQPGGWATPPVLIGRSATGYVGGASIVTSSRLTYNPTVSSDSWAAVVAAFLPPPSTGLTVTLVADSSGSPGSDIATLGTIDDADVTTGAHEWFQFDFSSVALTSGTRYWVKVTGNADTALDWDVAGSTTGTGVAGESWAIIGTSSGTNTGSSFAYQMRVNTEAFGGPTSWQSSATLAGTSTLTVQGLHAQPAVATLAASSALSVAAIVRAAPVATLAGTSAITATATILDVQARATVNGTSSLLANGLHGQPASAVLPAASGIAATGTVAGPSSSATLAGTSAISTLSRASNATYFDASGVLQEVGPNVARLGYDPVTLASLGLLIEPSATNGVPNPRGEGAVNGTPGTYPPNWTASNAFCSINVVGSGTESGMPYVDLRFVGTTSGTANAISFTSPTLGTRVAASNGQTWASSVYVRLVAGSLTNISGVNLATAMDNSSGGFVSQIVGSNITPTSAALVTQRFTQVATLNGGGTVAFVRPALRCTFSSGVAIDATFRIGGPQIELGSSVTSLILPPAGSPSQYTRAAEITVGVLASATATLAGSSSLTAAARIYDTQGRVTLPGASMLFADGLHAQPGAAALSGTGGLAATISAATEAAIATLAGSGGLLATATIADRQARATLAAASDLTAQGLHVQPAVATLAGDSAINAAAKMAASVSATLPAVGNLSADGLHGQPASALLPATSTLSADGTVVISTQGGSAVLSGTSALTATANVADRQARTTLPATSDIIADGLHAQPGGAVLPATSTIAADAGPFLRSATATLPATSTLSVSPAAAVMARGTLTGTSTLLADGLHAQPGEATLDGISTLTIGAGPSLRSAAATLPADASLAVSPAARVLASATLAATSTIAGDGFIPGRTPITGSALLAGDAGLSATAKVAARATATLPADAALGATATIRDVQARATLPATGTLAASGLHAQPALATLAATSGLPGYPLGLLIPAYIYPTLPDFTAIVTALAARRIPAMVIANAGDPGGPGTVLNPDWAAGIASLRAIGVTVLGYVATDYGARSDVDIEAEVDAWNTIYAATPVDGIFFDTMASDPSFISKYEGLYGYAHSHGYSTVVANPGVIQPVDWIGHQVADIVVAWENTSWPNPTDLAANNIDRATRAVIVKTQATLDTAQIEAVRPYAEWIYVTDDPNFTTTPPYLTDLTGLPPGAPWAAALAAATTTLPGAGALAASTIARQMAAATLAATSTLVGDGFIPGRTPINGSALLAGDGALTAAAKVAAKATGLLPANADLAATATILDTAARATLAATSTLLANGLHAQPATATLQASSTLTAATIQKVSATATLAADGALAAAPIARLMGRATLGAVSFISTSAQAPGGNATLAGDGSLTASAVVVVAVSATLDGQGAATGQGSVAFSAGALFAGATALAGAGIRAAWADGALNASGALAAAPSRFLRAAAATLPGDAGLGALARQLWASAATLGATSGLTGITTNVALSLTALFPGAGGLGVPAPIARVSVSANLPSDSWAAGMPSVVARASATLDGTADIDAGGNVPFQNYAELGGASGLRADARVAAPALRWAREWQEIAGARGAAGSATARTSTGVASARGASGVAAGRALAGVAEPRDD